MGKHLSEGKGSETHAKCQTLGAGSLTCGPKRGARVELLDGLREYQKDAEYWRFTVHLEDLARDVAALLRRNVPTADGLGRCGRFLVAVEKWKAMCIQEQTGLARTNSQQAVWRALRGALEAGSDREALLSVMELRGFGVSRDSASGQRRAKRATAVMRFLDPHEWGVVDWGTVAVLGLLRKCDGEVDRALAEARREYPKQLRQLLDIIDEEGACQTNREYRAMRSHDLPRAADVDMALFGVSLMAWPIGNPCD